MVSKRISGGLRDFGDDHQSKPTKEDLEKIEKSYELAKERKAREEEQKRQNEIERERECYYHSCHEHWVSSCEYCGNRFCSTHLPTCDERESEEDGHPCAQYRGELAKQKERERRALSDANASTARLLHQAIAEENATMSQPPRYYESYESPRAPIKEKPYVKKPKGLIEKIKGLFKVG